MPRGPSALPAAFVAGMDRQTFPNCRDMILVRTRRPWHWASRASDRTHRGDRDSSRRL